MECSYLYSWVAHVAAGMVVRKHLQGPLILALEDLEARALRHPVDASQLDDGRQALKQSDRAPGPVAVDLQGTPTDPGDD